MVRGIWIPLSSKARIAPTPSGHLPQPGHEKAAKLSGIKTERLTFGTFVTMGALAALAGLIFSARLNTATPKAGVGFELDVIAAVFIGGSSAFVVSRQ